jgi:hypothetical protein
MKKVEVTCECCKKIYLRSRSKVNEAAKNNWKQFCSKKCQGGYRRRREVRNCSSCKKVVSVRISAVKRSKSDNFFCNESCAASFNNKRRRHNEETRSKISTSLKNKGLEKVKTLKFCKICGCGYFKRTMFCSKECMLKSRRINSNYTELEKYRLECKFRFSLNSYPNEFEFGLIERYGWYSSKNNGDNADGVSRDHIVSVKYGFDNNISANIISHPANCQLMQQKKNFSKLSKCGMTLEELESKIEEWNIRYR